MSTKNKSSKKLNQKVTKETKPVVKSNVSGFTKKEVSENVGGLYATNTNQDNAITFFNANNDKFNLGKDIHWSDKAKVKPSALPEDILAVMKSNFMIHWFNNQSPLHMGYKKIDGNKIITGKDVDSKSFNVTAGLLLDMPKKSDFIKDFGEVAFKYIEKFSHNFIKAFSKSVKSLQDKANAVIEHKAYLDAVENAGGDLELIDIEEPKASTGRDRTIIQTLQWEIIGEPDEHSKKDKQGNNQANEKSLRVKVSNSKDDKVKKEWLKIEKAFAEMQKALV